MTGEGDDFCSGADVSGAGRRTARCLTGDAPMSRPSRRCTPSRQPVVARVTGVCVGVGFNMALACDLVVAGDDARFSEIFARRGLSIDGGGLVDAAADRRPASRAKELALLADILTAVEAERLGLVTRVVPRADLDATVAEIAGRLAAGPPLALSPTKRLLNQSAHVTLSQALEAEAQAQTVNFGTRDTARGAAGLRRTRHAANFEGR